MKKILIASLILFASCKKDNPVDPEPGPLPDHSIHVTKMAFSSYYISDTVTTGTETHFGTDTVTYIFTSATNTQNCQVTFKDVNGANLSGGDTLISTNVLCELHDTTFVLQTPVIGTVEYFWGTTTLLFHWCILPINGASVDCEINLTQ